jgi:hypothetical protein
MTVGELKKLLKPIDDDLQIIVTGNLLDEDGVECEAWYAISGVSQEMDEDTAEHYVRFGCDTLDDFQHHGRDS